MSGIKSIQMKNNILNEKLAEYRISLLQITYIVKGKQCSPLFIRKSPVCANLIFTRKSWGNYAVGNTVRFTHFNKKTICWFVKEEKNMCWKWKNSNKWFIFINFFYKHLGSGNWSSKLLPVSNFAGVKVTLLLFSCFTK